MELSTLFALIVVIAVVGLIFWVCWWAVTALGLPEPFNKIAQVVIIIAALAFMLLYIAPKLLAMAGV